LNNLILVGFMGTGKSAVGKGLARRLDRAFVDLDERIERGAGCTVAEIFEREGEAGFRKRERAAVEALADTRDAVIATGGGVLLDSENLKRLQGLGLLVCLTARPEVILGRVEKSPGKRPLLGKFDPAARVRELLTVRAAVYRQAALTVDTSDHSIEEVVELLLKKPEIWKGRAESK